MASSISKSPVEKKVAKSMQPLPFPTRRPKGGWKSNQQKQNRTPDSKPKDKSYNSSSGFGFGSSNQSNQSGSRKYFKCGRNGHMQKECWTGDWGIRDCTNKCQRCGRAGHESRECRAGAYTKKLYKEPHELRKSQRESLPGHPIP